jgi:MoaA/NifB/PqqE/SkfB family radical SAM enzyme
MHEILAHPDAPTLISLFDRVPDIHGFRTCDSFVTGGIPIATRHDWADVLSALQDIGVDTMWFSLHGFGRAHDEIVNRPGAYAEVWQGMDRARSRGFALACTIYVTRDNASQVPIMASALQTAGVGTFCWDVARYVPTGRSHHYEPHRPALADVQPVVDEIVLLTSCRREAWCNLESMTEAAYVRRAVGGGWPPSDDRPDRIALVCRSNFDLHSGRSGLYGARHGNLRTENPDEVFRRALAAGHCPEELLYLGAMPAPSAADLARTVGDPHGQKLYFDSDSMRYRWLDQWILMTAA